MVRRRPFLPRPRTWLVALAGAALGVVVWWLATGPDCVGRRRRIFRECTPMAAEVREEARQPDRWHAVLILGG